MATEWEDALVFIDSSVVKAHRAAAEQIKVYAVLNALGRPLRLTISGEQLNDNKMIDCLLNWSKPPLAIAADKA
ncbi:hypothetical protein ACFOY8_21040 [Thalassospira xianhensis]|uniref:hypothetical protein n=1 Tax=Thalassospira xianhensis TaxID=478503 RepID=UPI000DED6913|nr:hypothetical protein [Thalassospira xianhensis]